MGAAASVIGSVGSQQGSGIIGGLIGGIAGLQYASQIGGPNLRRMGEQEAREARLAGREVIGKQVAGYARAGVRTDVGTPLHVAAATAARSELAALRMLFTYKQAAWEQKEQARIQLVSSLLMAGGSVGQAVLQRRVGSSQKLGLTSLYGPSGSSVNTIPSPYSIDYGGYA